MSGRDDEEHGGYPIGNPFRRGHQNGDDSPGTDNEVPVDLAAVQADDALLDMLSGSGVVRGESDAELTRVLVAWRRDVDTEPFGELVDTDTAMAVIGAARRPAARRHPVLGPVAAAAAVLVIAFSGVGLVAKSAQPGDNLFGLTKVLYADYARSAEAAQQAKIELADAETALRAGKTAQARMSLKKVQLQLQVIAEQEGHTTLAARHDELEAKLDGLGGPPTSAVPLPPPTDSSSPSASMLPVPSASVSATPSVPPKESSAPSSPSSTPSSPASAPSTPTSGTSQATPRAGVPPTQTSAPAAPPVSATS